MKHRKKQKEPMRVELIPSYMPQEDFADKKEVVQNLIVRILLETHSAEQNEKNSVQLSPLSEQPMDRRTPFIKIKLK